MACLFCQKEKKLFKAHIIPEGFFRRMRKDAPYLLLLRQTPDRILRNRSPIGVYDKQIVCGACESIWNDWDTHAQEILSHDRGLAKTLHRSGQAIGWRIDQFDYKKLKLFFISMLWRASVSKHAYFCRVRLGRYETVAKKMIVDKDPGQPEQFGVVITRFGKHKFDVIMFDPFREKVNHVNFYRFYMAGYVIYIKVDRRPMPPTWNRLVIRGGKPIFVARRNLDKSGELQLILKFARS